MGCAENKVLSIFNQKIKRHLSLLNIFIDIKVLRVCCGGLRWGILQTFENGYIDLTAKKLV
jgi:hypothetical protein